MTERCDEVPLVADWLGSRCESLLMRSLLSRMESSGLCFVTQADKTKVVIVDPNDVYPDESQQTVMHMLFRHIVDQSDLAMYITALIDIGVDINRQNAENQTPLMLAILHRASQEILLLMVNLPDISLEMQDINGKTALNYAVESGGSGIVRLLSDLIVKRGLFSVFLLKNSDQETAEQVAVRMGDKISARILNKRRLKLLARITKQLQEKGHKFPNCTPALGISKSLSKASPFLQVSYAQTAVRKWKKFAADTASRKRAFSAVRMQELLPPISEDDGKDRARSASSGVIQRNTDQSENSGQELLAENLQETSEGVLKNFVMAVNSMTKNVCTSVLFAKDMLKK